MKTKLFAAGPVICVALVVTSRPVSATIDVGRRYPAEKTTYVDEVTELEVTVLTTDSANDAKIYQTHPQWTADGKYIVFRSNRAATGTQAFAVNEASGEIIQLTDDRDINAGTLHVARKSIRLYYLRGGRRFSGRRRATRRGDETNTSADNRADGPSAAGGDAKPTQIIELGLAALLADREAGTINEPAAYERVCATLPSGMRESGGFGLDADERIAYIGVRGADVGAHLPAGVEPMGVPPGARMGAGPGGLRSVDLQTGEIKVIIDVPFQMGHVQANPWMAGEIVYCHETGGDAPQRMWTVMADGTGNRPLYVETPDEWVTHETIVTGDEVMFNILGHLPRLRTKPSGIAVVNFRTDDMKILGQVEEPFRGRRLGGFWHCNGSPDGRWAVGDTFAGNVHLINRQTGEITLLTTDHKMRPDHCHPSFSPDSTRILIQSGHLSDGRSLDLMVIPIPPGLLSRD